MTREDQCSYRSQTVSGRWRPYSSQCQVQGARMVTDTVSSGLYCHEHASIMEMIAPEIEELGRQMSLSYHTARGVLKVMAERGWRKTRVEVGR